MVSWKARRQRVPVRHTRYQFRKLRVPYELPTETRRRLSDAAIMVIGLLVIIALCEGAGIWAWVKLSQSLVETNGAVVSP